MPTAIATPLRRALWQRHQQGQSAAEIADALGLSPRTARHLLRRLRAGGAEALAPAYRGPAAAGPHRDLRRAALQLRRQHGGWGAGIVRAHPRRRHPRRALPATRTLQRWSRAAGLGPAPRGRRPAAAGRARAARPHDVWQVDASERVRLRGGQQVCWLRVAGECSGAALATAVSPPRAVGRHRPRRGAAGAAAGLRPLGPARGGAGG
jgi:DNA-binding transcriptional ArsR family regulator